MGGTVLVRTCPMLIESKYRITGVAVLEAVEGGNINTQENDDMLLIEDLGFALEALPHMHKLLDSRPDGFGSVEEAIEWQSV